MCAHHAEVNLPDLGCVYCTREHLLVEHRLYLTERRVLAGVVTMEWSQMIMVMSLARQFQALRTPLVETYPYISELVCTDPCGYLWQT